MSAGPQVSAGARHACAVTREGSVYCWGHGGSGELGVMPAALGTCTTTSPFDNDGGTEVAACSPTPRRIAGLPRIAKVAAAEDFTCALDYAGRIWCWGSNRAYQLGHGPGTEGDDPHCGVPARPPTAYCNPTPHRVADFTFVDVFTGGGRSACGLTRAGGFVCWGSASETVVPAAIFSVGVVNGASNGNAYCVIKSDGLTFCHNAFVAVRLAAPSDGGATMDAGVDAAPVLPPPFLDAVDVQRGNGACARRADGTVWCWENNYGGQLGNGTCDTVDHPGAAMVPGLVAEAIDFRGAVACALHDGALDCWGLYGRGLLGDGTFGVGVPGAVDCPSGRAQPSPKRVILPAEVASVSTSSDLMIARLRDGRVMTWGSNRYGELGHAPFTAGDVEHDGAVNPTPGFVAGFVLP
ncbi:MAG: hypothetical protein KF819_29610 [Labilithrix sp.]|nr:hypothetical protein [Labilithrix sp.]